MDYISDYQYITVIAEIYLYPIIMIYRKHSVNHVANFVN